MRTEVKVVMFTDEVKSTEHTTQRTPMEIKQVCDDQSQLTAEVVGQCNGTILKDTGDGAFIVFASCSDAVRCGFVLQKRVRERNKALKNPHLKFELHIGIDTGELVVLPDGDLRGNAANRAARVCSVCPAGQVYFTDKVKSELHPREATCSSVGPFKLKGVKGKTTLYRLGEWLGPVEPSHNPFFWRQGITDAEAFFDRDNEQRTLREYLHGKQNCQIVGPRRIGKTSLLLQIERIVSEWEKGVVVAYLDLQDPRCFSLTGWFHRAAQRLAWPTPPKTLIEFADAVEAMLINGQRPVLCLDEFEELISRPDQFTHDFFSTLRACGQQGMSILTVSKRPLSELTRSNDPASPFYNAFPILRLGPFSQEDAQDFVILGRPGGAHFTKEERDVILDFSRGHPLALQVICFHMVQAKHNAETLATAIRRATDDMEAHLPGWKT